MLPVPSFYLKYSLKDLRIYKAVWCRQCHTPFGECKAHGGIMNTGNIHRLQDPIAERKHGGFPSKSRINCSKSYQRAYTAESLSLPTIYMTRLFRSDFSAELRLRCVLSDLVRQIQEWIRSKRSDQIDDRFRRVC